MRCDMIADDRYVSAKKGYTLHYCRRAGCRQFAFLKSGQRLGAVRCRHLGVQIGDLVHYLIPAGVVALAGLLGLSLGAAALTIAALHWYDCTKCRLRRAAWNRRVLAAPNWAYRLLGMARPLPWDDASYAGQIVPRTESARGACGCKP